MFIEKEKGFECGTGIFETYGSGVPVLAEHIGLDRFDPTTFIY